MLARGSGIAMPLTELGNMDGVAFGEKSRVQKC